MTADSSKYSTFTGPVTFFNEGSPAKSLVSIGADFVRLRMKYESFAASVVLKSVGSCECAWQPPQLLRISPGLS